ncbi:hypothetical protein [Parapedobacter koreensis]|uniref:Uncharacterized protein n=1 Tax=Parapedobacter koreensis TaxID=332977 RepID=A0A1H7TZ17_9SPHI|nr:hypothetical protein [Parapedobacter koreensis]SEL89227.1 hypothetical protein SAMN05421740_112140 [Parapedobacter koreensis]
MMSYSTNNTYGVLSSALDGTIVNHIYTYIIDILDRFKVTTEENENAITNKLCISLNFNRGDLPFFFHHQNLEDEHTNTSTDFAAFGIFGFDETSPALIKFEAKRLNCKLPTKREREYVIGEYELSIRKKNSGGIERFKNGRHGKDVTHAALIGYIQTDSPSIWLEKVNGWIQDEIKSSSDPSLRWNDNDILKADSNSGRVASFTSQSIRLSGDELIMKHIWVDFANLE